MKKFDREILRLYLVTDRELCGNKDLLGTCLEAIDGGVSVVQLREKKLDTGDFYRTTIVFKNALKQKEIPLIINDRIDIALACDADGVHLGQSDMPLKIARRILGENKIIGVSVSTVDEAIEAERDGADYLGLSPIFATPTKTDTPAPIGIEGIKKICASVSIPIVGIGGINRYNARDVILAGCDGVAVVSAIIASENPYDASRELFDIVSNSIKERNSNV